MKFEELQQDERLAYHVLISKMREADYYRHPLPSWTNNEGPGGWVHKAAQVHPSAAVLPDSVVLGSAKVGEYSMIRGCSIVSGNAVVGARSVIFLNSVITDNSVIAPGCIIGSSKFHGKAHVNFQLVIGGESERNEFFKKGPNVGPAKEVFFRFSHVGVSDEIMRKRNEAFALWNDENERSGGTTRKRFPGLPFFNDAPIMWL